MGRVATLAGAVSLRLVDVQLGRSGRRRRRRWRRGPRWSGLGRLRRGLGRCRRRGRDHDGRGLRRRGFGRQRLRRSGRSGGRLGLRCRRRRRWRRRDLGQDLSRCHLRRHDGRRRDIRRPHDLHIHRRRRRFGQHIGGRRLAHEEGDHHKVGHRRCDQRGAVAAVSLDLGQRQPPRNSDSLRAKPVTTALS